jgi:hypothetical protein
VSYSAIDPDGVLAMSAATVALSGTLAQRGEALQSEMDAVSDLVGGAPSARQRTDAVAGDLAELAGWARSVALHYVDDVKPLRELASLGFWLPDVSKLGWDSDKTVLENLDNTARSDEFGAFVLGVSGALLERYRRWQLYVPKPGAPVPPSSLRLPPPDDVVRGTPVVRRPSGLLVPRGSSADPGIRRLGSGPSWYQPGQRGLVTDPAFGRPPTWARVGGRALGVAGTGLTLYDSYMSQWEHDGQYHPDWSTGQRVANASYNMATEGGGAVAGGLIGAKIGAAAGSFIPIPVVGTVGGALVGGAIGAFVGSKAGKAVGRGLKEGGEALVDGAKDVWDSVFG